MTCYTRPLAFFLLVLAAALAAVGMFGLLFDIIAFIAGTLILTVAAISIVARTTRRRAASGACTTCRYECQGYLDGSRPGPVIIVDTLEIREPVMWPHAGELTVLPGREKARP